MDIPSGTIVLDGGLSASVVNSSGLPTEVVLEELRRQDEPVLRAMESWARATQPLQAWDVSAMHGPGPSGSRNGGIFARDRYVTPTRFFDQVRLAQYAVVDDDVVSGVEESTESLAFSQVGFFALDADEQDIYNQVAAGMGLDGLLRQMWRELFTVSQCYVAVVRGRRTFRVRGRTENGVARRRTIEALVPTRVAVINPLKVIPVGNTVFGEEQLAYIATPLESSNFAQVLDPTRTNRASDPLVESLIVAPYRPTRDEERELGEMGVNVKDLFLLNPNNVFRHTLTRSNYERVAPVRMRAVFELLDMKQQLRQMERAHLIGGSNFIVVITKGTDEHPARPEELDNLRAQVRTVARVPVMVGDHRLHVEIVTPKLDNTLRAERWNTIDGRITARLYQMFVLGNYFAGATGDDSVKLVKVIARGMESRRHMMRRTLERHIFDPLFTGNESFTTPPKLEFHPRSIALDFDAAYASFLFDLRQSNELSRETILNQFDLDQALEAEYRKREEEQYDEVFKTQVPFSTPNPVSTNNGGGGARTETDATPSAPRTRDNGGGRRNGGGAAPGSGQGQPPRRATRPAAGAEEPFSDVSTPELLRAALARLENGGPDAEAER